MFFLYPYIVFDTSDNTVHWFSLDEKTIFSKPVGVTLYQPKNNMMTNSSDKCLSESHSRQRSLDLQLMDTPLSEQACA